MQAIAEGAQECLGWYELTDRDLARIVQLAITRHARFRAVQQRSAPTPPGTPAKGFARQPHAEQRCHPRYILTRPLLVIPVLPNGEPDGEGRAEGFSVDMSLGGIGFEVGVTHLPARLVAVGVETDSGELHFATAEVGRSTPSSIGVHVGAKFVPAASDLFSSENLTPKFDPATYQLRTPIAEETLDKWAALGTLQAAVIDWVQVCPECQSLPTFRHACRACGSARLVTCRLIHHFACAHVGYVVDYERDGELICPKCRTRRLVVGSDFEHLDGPYRCLDCDWSDVELESVGQCLKCGHRFPGHQALEKELLGYHANRLDPLALIGSS